MYCNLLRHVLTGFIQCSVVYFDSVAFATLSGDLFVRDIAKEFFPVLDVWHSMLLKHDPLSGISCSSGLRLVYMEHVEVLKGEFLQGISQQSKQVFISNKDPLVMTRKQFATEIETWTIICKPRAEDSNCSVQMMKENSSLMESCLKYELIEKRRWHLFTNFG